MFSVSLNVLTENASDASRAYAAITGYSRHISGEYPSVSVSSHALREMDPDEEFIDEKTMLKVLDCFKGLGMPQDVARNVIDEMLSVGILFRERVTDEGTYAGENRG